MSDNVNAWDDIYGTIHQAQRHGKDLHHILLLVHSEGRKYYYDRIYGNIGQREQLYQIMIAKWKLHQEQASWKEIPQPSHDEFSQVHYRLIHMLRLLNLDITVLEQLNLEHFDRYRRWKYFKACENVVREGLKTMDIEITFWADVWRHNTVATVQAEEYRKSLWSMQKDLDQIDEPDRHTDERSDEDMNES